MNTFEELTIEERIKLLHHLIDELEGSTTIDIEVTKKHVVLPGYLGLHSNGIVAHTGETVICIVAYNPTKDSRIDKEKDK